MSREIKFRVYTGKRFWYFDIHDGFNAENNDTFKDPEQYIGLKDENGKEIYEGDIMDGQPHRDASKVNHVLFEDAMFCLASKKGHFAWGSETAKELTIIGNIHENPELLN